MAGVTAQHQRTAHQPRRSVDSGAATVTAADDECTVHLLAKTPDTQELRVEELLQH